jgi:Putative adhesin
MPTFDTPQPISAVVELSVGDVRITASDRDDTVVEIRPSDDSHEPDVRAAELTRVEYSAGRLLVRVPKQRGISLFRGPGLVDVTIDLPAGSQLYGDASVAAFHCAGRLGETRIKTSTGDIQLEYANSLEVSTGAGAIVVDRVAGPAEVSTGSGRLRLREIDGAAVIKNSNGDSWIGEVTGDLRVNAANGSITVDHASGDVDARSANGDVRVGGVTRGSATLKTSMGEIEVGIQAGTAARLDVHTQFGRIHNQLDSSDGPGPSDQTVEVSARTSYGDIVIRRSGKEEK